ncbi:MAG: ribokinase [Clostridia bacterium]|nr:ribokinase [Clostridia bacterium]
MSKIAVIGIVGNSVFLEVDKFHEGGETVEAKSVHFELGGKGFNQAVAAARYGAEVSFLAAVGSDSFGAVRSFLENESIKAYLSKKEQQTAFASIVTDKIGSNHVTVYQGAQLSGNDVSSFENEIKGADILLLNNEVTEEVNLRAIEIAKRYGVRVVLNPAPARQTSQYILENVDLFTPNEHETLGIEEKENVVITVGKRGCIIKSENNKSIPAVSVARVVDTTGAGDTFNGVLAASLAEGNTLTEAVTAANIASSIGVTRRYAVSSIPTKKEIEEIMKCKRD